jgi:hypothetical protein
MTEHTHHMHSQHEPNEFGKTHLDPIPFSTLCKLIELAKKDHPGTNPTVIGITKMSKKWHLWYNIGYDTRMSIFEEETV